VNALGRVHDEASAAVLAPLLRDPDASLRREAVLSLGKIGGESALSALAAALADSDPQVRWRACRSLGEIGGPAACELLAKAKAQDADATVREHAGLALDRCGAAK
jgi:HEAT repeat protein